VFNGSDYLVQALDSVLGQTFKDFELLVQDNASTDDTAEICRTYMKKDSRIKYVRNRDNVGGAENYNLTVKRARGEYFKWVAHDDVCAPNFINRCVEVLDRDPSVILCAGETELINDDGSRVNYDSNAGCFVTKDGRHVGRIDRPHRAESSNPARRYWDILVNTMRTFEIFGVIRTDVLRKTVLMENYYGSDKVLLAELCLRGRMLIVPEVLLYRRCHSNQSSRLPTAQKGTWIGSRPQREMVTRIRKLIPAYFRAVHRTPMGLGQKLLCDGVIAYRFIAPVTWHKQFNLGHYTDSAQ
jgi:glycosyltransferase involved in cell wall biosynthesis